MFGQVIRSWAGWPGIPGAASLPVDAQATFLRVYGCVPGWWLSGVSALMRSLLQLRAIGARYATVVTAQLLGRQSQTRQPSALGSMG